MDIRAIQVEINSVSEQGLYAGGWATSREHPYTRITAEPLPAAKTFLLYCVSMVGDGVASYRITVDGKQIIAQMFEGSSVFVEGKHVEIQQTSEHAAISCTWQVVQEAPVEQTGLQWSAYPGSGQALVAAFNQDQEFVLSVNRVSNGCNNTSMNVILDGAAVKDASGNPLTLLAGSSLICSGKIAAVIVDGVCSRPNESSVGGGLKIRKSRA